jgi:hypothetical protein
MPAFLSASTNFYMGYFSGVRPDPLPEFFIRVLNRFGPNIVDISRVHPV